MERKMACRALGLWPRELADIIAEYSDWTIQEKVDKLIGPPPCTADLWTRKSNPLFYHERLSLRWSDGGFIVVANATMYWSDDTFHIAPYRLGEILTSRHWSCIYGTGNRPMSTTEIEILDKWLATVK